MGSKDVNGGNDGWAFVVDSKTKVSILSQVMRFLSTYHYHSSQEELNGTSSHNIKIVHRYGCFIEDSCVLCYMCLYYFLPVENVIANARKSQNCIFLATEFLIEMINAAHRKRVTLHLLQQQIISKLLFGH